MKEIAVFEAKTRLSELLTEVQQGEQFTITRHGTPVARLVAAESGSSERAVATARRRQAEEAFRALALLRQDITLDVPLREAIEQGRD